MGESKMNSIVDVDRLLVEKAQSGDRRAFDELVLKYQKRIYELVYGFTHNINPDDAFDLSQEVFLKAWNSLDKFRKNSTFFTWLYRIAKNAGIDYTRKRKHRRNVSLDDDTSVSKHALHSKVSSEMPDKEVERMELGREIAKAVDQLPPRQKQVWVLRHYEGMTLKEIAEELGLRIGSVKAHLFNATRTLRKLLTPYVEGEL